MRRPTPRGARWRAFKGGLQTVHLWLGLILAIPILLISISGSALLLQREILAYSLPAATASGAQQPLTRIIAAGQKGVAAEATARSVVLPPRAGTPATVQFDMNGRPPRTAVHVDPISLDVLGTEPIVNRGPVLAFLIQLHAFLSLPAHIGFPIVGWMAVVMTFMALSGLVLWWPKKGMWRNALLMRKGATGLRFHVELHHVLGFWSSLVLLAMGVSGIYLVFPETFRAGVEAVLPEGVGSGEPPANYQAGSGPLDPDHALEAALAAMPGTRAVNVQLPPNLDLPYVVHLETTEFRPSAPPILVTLNARTGGITFVDDPRTYALGDKFLNLQHALHFGIGLGWIWKILVFASGIVPLVLAITGLNIWLKRRAARRPVAEAEALLNPAAE